MITEIILMLMIIAGLTIFVWSCSSLPTIAKEILLYPVLVFSITLLGVFTLSTYFYLYFIGTPLLGIIIHYFIMKKIDNTTSKIDVYIYIYTLFQIGIILAGIDEKYLMLHLLFGIIFYFTNIYCFYRFRKDKLLKIIIMPTIVSVLCILPTGLMTYILVITNP